MKTDEPKVVGRVLALLRQYGWENGHKKLEADVRAGSAGEDGHEVQQFFLGWMAAERGDYVEALRQFESVRHIPAIAGWIGVGEAFVALRNKEFPLAQRLLLDARQKSQDDPQLLATICHVEGAALFHQGDSDGARPLLVQAMKLYGPNHFAIGRVLDTMGMVHAGCNNFQGAREFFDRALILKRADDWAGLAVTHGQLGRLYLDWGYLNNAQHHFEEDLKICRQIGDEAGKAIMYNFLGQVCLVRGENEAAVNRTAAAREQWTAAAGWLESAVNLAFEHKWPITEAYARKDQARLAFAQGDLEAAEAHARAAEDIFAARGFKEGLAHVNRVIGILRTRQKRWEEAQAALRLARRYFEGTALVAEVARTLFAIAQTCAAAGEPRPLVSHALLEALAAAEACRRAHLVRQIEEELKINDPSGYGNCVYRRVRGRAILEDSVSLIDGIRESATVLFLDLQGSTEMSRFRDPGETMMMLNEMMGNLATVLRKHQAMVIGFRGDGFMALLRGARDAARGVEAALDLHVAMNAINEPRLVLGLPPLIVRIGVNSGDMFLGNVGTYDKLDFGAVGNAVNLAARLESNAEPGFPCIGRGTYEQVQRLYHFTSASPRTADLKGLGPTQMWDVAGRITAPPSVAPAKAASNQISIEALYETLAPQLAWPSLGTMEPNHRRDALSRFTDQVAEFARHSASAAGDATPADGSSATFPAAGDTVQIRFEGDQAHVSFNIRTFAAWLMSHANQQSLRELVAKAEPESKRFVFRRNNPTTWEFAFATPRTDLVGKNLAGFTYIALLLREADRELRPLDLLKHAKGPNRIASDDTDADLHPDLAHDESAEADRAMGGDDRLDAQAMSEYRDRAAELRSQLAQREDASLQKELHFIESQLRAATKPGGKRVAEGANRLKQDYNAVKKAIDKARAAIAEHGLVDLAAHLMNHVELSVKTCRYRNSARLEWDVA